MERTESSAVDSTNLEVYDASTSSITVRGVYLSGTETVLDVSFLRPCRKLAEIEVNEQTLSSPNEVSITYDFFDENSETVFLSHCADGYNLPAQTSSFKDIKDWGRVNYMSKVKHTWYHCKRYKADDYKPVITLTAPAKESLSKVAQKLHARGSEIESDDITDDIVAFFDDFGSHLSTGPFIVGGRCVQKLSVCLSGVENTSKEQAWIKLNEEFDNMKPEDFDIAIRRVVEIDAGEQYKQCVELCHQVHLFGGRMAETDLQNWREGLSMSNLVVSGVVTREHTIPVWDMISEDDDFQTDSSDSLQELLRNTWSRKHCKVQLEDKQKTAAKNGDSSTQIGTGVQHHELMRQLNLGGTIFGMQDAMVLRDDSKELEEDTSEVMMKFLHCLFTLDHRGRKCIKVAKKASARTPSIPGKTSRQRRKEVKISSMDVTLAIIHSCDNFLRQELLWKMAECRLAVPVLLPSLSDAKRVQFQLWSLRKIYKSWVPRNENNPVEKSVVTSLIPIVGFIRFGKIPFSKSKLINRIMGKLQDHETHPYFVDEEEESPCAKWSKGTVEASWYLPENSGDDRDSENGNALLDAVTFFNLRGDALKFPTQADFICHASTLVVILTDDSQYQESLPMIQGKIRSLAEHLLCIVCTSDPSKDGNIEEHDNSTCIFTAPSLPDIGEDICVEIKQVLWPRDDSEKLQTKSIQSLSSLCGKLSIEIDENVKDCIAAKNLATKVMESVRQSAETYRDTKLPLQGDLWKEWVMLDKKWSTGFIQTEKNPTMEHYHDELRQKMLQIRLKQLELEPESDFVDLIEALKQPPLRRQYFMEWLNVYLTELSQDKLPPLRREQRNIRNRIREISGKKREENEQSGRSTEEMDELSRREKEISSKIDGSLGMEHFIREMGQWYEAYKYLSSKAERTIPRAVNPLELPDIAADLLLNGYPFEVLDGDVGRVPIKWVEAVLRRVAEKIGNARVCTIAALGIQSSGKSTLLNSMFGVRFAVSAGRCTRGIFIQLLKVHESIQKVTQCEYVIVIDTEGLMAPELSNRDHFRYDNELATFALCLADLTIINIAGQTVGKDMINVLQIAAHAFIRMKTVNIKASCRIIQQFVADLKAVDTNEDGTQAIFMTLDEAVVAAAKDEGYEGVYTGFSDVFNFRRNEDVQYIPSLWQGAMSPPNYRYSEKIRKLRRLLIQDLKLSSRTFEKFSEHISNVWNAVKEENFIFSFQNCVIALRYKKFQHEYSKCVSDMRQSIIDWKSNAKHTLKNAEKDEVDGIKAKLQDEMVTLVEEEGGQIEKFILNSLRENTELGDGQLLQFEVEFRHDLKLTKDHFAQDATSALEMATENISQINDILLPECRNQLREKAKSGAAKPRKDKASGSPPLTDDQINQQFENLWKGWVEELCQKHPPKVATENDIKKEFRTYVVSQGEKKDISKELKRKLGITESGGRIQSPVNRTPSKNQNIHKTVDEILQRSIRALKEDIDKDLAFDTAIVQKLVDNTINALNDKHEGVTLTHGTKVNAVVRLCDQAVPIVFKGRQEYNSTHSLRALLESERENLKEDFRALCRDAFQDTRVAENLTSLFVEKAVEVTRKELGPTVYRKVMREYPYLDSKFTTFGYVLEDIAKRRDFNSYYRYIFEFDDFMGKWLLKKIAMSCTKEHEGTSVIKFLTKDKVEDICKDLVHCIRSTVQGSGRFRDWLTCLHEELRKNLPNLGVSFDDVHNLELFDVKDVTFLTETVCKLVEKEMKQRVMQLLRLPDVGEVERAEEILRNLPTRPHKEIQEHVTKGCTEQCPICRAPCNNVIEKHELHWADLHYPEGIVGCVTAKDNCLAFSICNSSIATDDPYWDGKRRRRYSDYKKDFPGWVIREVREGTPLNYWKWVMNTFNADFARLYGREQAKLPAGWTEITQDQALEDLRVTYALR